MGREYENKEVKSEKDEMLFLWRRNEERENNLHDK